MQPCLGGDGKTLMFVNINCAPDSAKETLCSLRFAAKVNQCETGARGGARKHVSQLGTEPHPTTATPAEVGLQNVGYKAAFACILNSVLHVYDVLLLVGVCLHCPVAGNICPLSCIHTHKIEDPMCGVSIRQSMLSPYCKCTML